MPAQEQGIVVAGGYTPEQARAVLGDFLRYTENGPHDALGDIQIMKWDDDQSRYRLLEDLCAPEALLADFLAWIREE